MYFLHTHAVLRELVSLGQALALGHQVNRDKIHSNSVNGKASVRYCWYDYPYHTVSTDVWCYYMMELTFYWSLSISQFFDVKRKDFLEMMIHHNATILLMMFSWTDHFTRIGNKISSKKLTSILLCFDERDIFILTKMSQHSAGIQRTIS